MGIGLSIVFSGLCALVADGSNGPGQVILVDARSLGEVDGATIPAHAPTLVLDLGSLVNPEASQPDRVVAGWPGAGAAVGQVGLWDLAGSEVRIRAPGSDVSGMRLFRSDDGATSWPHPPGEANDPASWRDVRYIADMSSIVGDGRISPELLANPPGRLPRGIAARIHLDTGLIEAGLPSREDYRDDVFEFSASGSRGALRQALSDTIRWTLETRPDVVVIEIAPVSGGPVRRLILKARENAHQVFVGNMPVHEPERHDHNAMSDESFAALHFGVYYQLLDRVPDSRPLPRLLSSYERRAAAGWMGPICPPARFRTN